MLASSWPQKGNSVHHNPKHFSLQVSLKTTGAVNELQEFWECAMLITPYRVYRLIPAGCTEARLSQSAPNRCVSLTGSNVQRMQSPLCAFQGRLQVNCVRYFCA
eukprot:6473513-Amphidinium_carterae.1